MSNPRLRITGVSKTYPGTVALDDLSFEVRPGEIHALVGGNGSGKSTCIQILAGVVPADAGVIEVNGQAQDLHRYDARQAAHLGVHTVHQKRTSFLDLSIMENLSMGRGFERGRLGKIAWRQVRSRVERILDEYGIDADPDDRVDSLNPAQQTLLEIARVLQDQDAASDGLLILDEPTATLTQSESEQLFEAMRQYAANGQAVLFVSHRLDEIFQVADRITVLRDGRLVDTVDSASIDRDRLVELMVGHAVSHGRGSVRDAKTDQPALELQGLRGGKVKGADLTAYEGEVLGITGAVGSGRSTLLSLIFGAHRPEGGEILLDGQPISHGDVRSAVRSGIAFVPQDRVGKAIFPDLSVAENFILGRAAKTSQVAVIRRGAEEKECDAALLDYRVKAVGPEIGIASLSGGNQQKVSLARWLSQNPRVLLLDEPTQGVDVAAREDLWQLIRASVGAGRSAIVVSSDIEELVQLCDRIVVMAEGEVAMTLENGEITEEAVHAALVGA